jgi:hypothetical protein
MIEPLVIDDFVPLEFQEELKKKMFSINFPWYAHTLDTDVEKVNQRTYAYAPGLAHVMLNKDGKQSNFLEETYPIMERVAQTLHLNEIKLGLARAFLQYPLTISSGLTTPHIDNPNVNHTVVVYYVKDSDGDTVLYNKSHNMGDTVVHDCALCEEDIVLRVKPKQGRVLIFEGSTFHSLVLPQQDIRCIMNFNLFQ